MNFTFESLTTLVSGAVKALGYVAAAGGIYVSLGLPIPATVDYVDGKLGVVSSGVSDLKVVVLEGQLRDINSQRNFLSAERTTLSRTLDRVDDSAKTIIQRRLSEIESTVRLTEIQEETILKDLAEARK